MNKRKILIVISILAFIVIVGGISYSYFVYNKDVGEVSLETGEISISLSGVNGDKTLTNVIPLSDNDGIISSDYFDFTVNSTVDTDKIYYEVYLLPKSGNTLDTDYLKTYLTDQNNVKVREITYYSDLANSEKGNGKIIYRSLVETNDSHTSRNETKNFRLRLWLDENYSEQTSKTFEFDIYLYAKNVDDEYDVPDYGHNLIRKGIAKKQAKNISGCYVAWDDTLDTVDISDDITYLSGDNSCVDMNYVWYSGKLWRITAIYPDGTMKLVTENSISDISFNTLNNPVFYTDANNTSWIYQWLNEDFYDSLYEPENFIDTSKKWNMTPTDPSIPDVLFYRLPETIMINSNVGLLNTYDQYRAYYCTGGGCNNTSFGDAYINNSSAYWLLNAYDSTQNWVSVSPYYGYYYYTHQYIIAGVRPAIYFKSDVELVGKGTKESPFKVLGDKDIGEPNDKINTRISGEYVKLKNGNNEMLFRIIGVEDNKTKIVSVDYADNHALRKFAMGNTNYDGLVYGSGQTATTGANTWYNYLTGTYYTSLVNTYGNLFVNGTYYMGDVGLAGLNYKAAICSTPGYTTKTCPKTSQSGTFNVGLPRYGELFAMIDYDDDNPLDMVLLGINTADNNIPVANVDPSTSNYNPTLEYGARPTLYLNSNVEIISGSGTQNDPYVVGL